MDAKSMDAMKVAIIGLACRVSGVDKPSEYWQAIATGRDTFRSVSDAELLARGVTQRDLDDPNYVRANRSLPGIEGFDAAFFGITPREARYMDPQQRVFLECCYEALEVAGYRPGETQLNVGVFAGSATSTYMLHHILPNSSAQSQNEVLYEHSHGNDKDYLTTVASYRLNLAGPSMSINTACSSALLSTVQACKSLLDYDCDLALAGGVRIEVPAGVGYKHRKGGILSPDGRCFVFDAGAQGTVFADGAGVVLLKRLEDASAAGDFIYATISGFASNNDGAAKAGYAAPGPEGQESVLREALAFAGVAAETVGYVEAHGTGTVVGDPIEFQALSRVYSAAPDGKPYCALGSVKANFGHLNTAAGVAGLIKAVQALHYKMLPPQINFRKLNPEIPLAGSAFYISTQLRPWEPRSFPRRAGVSSFGVGGTNVHVILEEAPEVSRSAPNPGTQLLVLSAKTAVALQAQVAQLKQHLAEQPQSLVDVAYTLQQARRHFPYRASFVCDDLESAIAALSGPASPCEPVGGSPAKVIFMLPGQGSQYLGMGRQLYDAKPVYREAVDRCLAILSGRPEAGAVRAALLLDGESSGAGEAALQTTAVTQPALFIVEYALCQLWMSLGVQPDALIGHSLGEYVAACLAGVMQLPDALTLVAIRGQLMQTLAPGAMVSAAIGAAELAGHLQEGCEIAASNSPTHSVAAGPQAAIAELLVHLDQQGIQAKQLDTSHAFHCAMVEAVVPAFGDALRRVRLTPPSFPYVSNVTGTWITAQEATSIEYWLTHLRRTVRFFEGLSAILERFDRCVLVEVGPGRTLSQLARKQPRKPLHVVDSLRQSSANERKHLLISLGLCWQAGVSIDWNACMGEVSRRRIPLPTYPFQRTRHWIDVDLESRSRAAGTGGAKRAELSNWFYVPAWKLAYPPLGASPAQERQRYLLFTTASSAALATDLRAQGHEVRQVRPGERFVNEEDILSLNPNSREEFQRLWDTLREERFSPSRIVFAWGLPTDVPPDEGWVLDAGHVQEVLTALLFLAQELKPQDLSPAAQLRIITANVFRVVGNERIFPGNAPLVGACRSIADELHYLTCQAIDLDLQARTPWWRALLRELDTTVSQPVVALRNGRRWVEQFDSMPLAPGPQGQPLSAGGTYLITGGLGGVGKIVTSWLAATPGVNIVLLGRQALPPRELWQATLESVGTAERLRNDLLFLQELASRGVRVLALGADVADPAQLARALDTIEREFGHLDGVFHLAGVPSNDTIEFKTPRAVAQTLAPKVQGTWNLYRLLKSRRPGFVALFSSLSAVIGGIKQFEYSAANAFLDAFAHLASGEECRWLSINWDAWQAGMAVNLVVPDHLRHLKSKALEVAIGATEGIDALERLLASSGQAQLVVSTRDLATRSVARNRATLTADAPVVQAPARPAHVTGFSAPRNETEGKLAGIWSALIGYERIGRNDNFFELGGDSLLATKVVAAINSELRVDIGVRDFLESKDIEDLARFIDALSGAPQDELASVAPVQEQVW
jgi:acyl transferase domain-containing protein